MFDSETPWDRTCRKEHEDHWGEDAKLSGTILGVAVGWLGGLLLIATIAGALIVLGGE